tara:strand:+ start:1855 stop:2325 length:471 start_codon:yes stop_codon:yes gene_type:complete
MHIHLITVSSKQKKWEKLAFDDYKARLPSKWRFQFDEINTIRRKKNESTSNLVKEESKKILTKIKSNESIIVLDEEGENFTTKELYLKLQLMSNLNSNLCFVIGGPDGISEELKQKSSMNWSLTNLTLPHGLAKIVFIEQIYRLWTLESHHPYHRD